MSDAQSEATTAQGMMFEAMLLKGYSFKQFTKLTDEQVEAVYTLAYRSFNMRRYEKAEQLFEFLSSLDHYDARYLIGLGACRQKQKNYHRAIDAYSAAALLEMENPVPPLRAAECHLALGDREKAELGAQAAVYWAGDDPKHAKWKERAETILKGIEARRARESKNSKESEA